MAGSILVISLAISFCDGKTRTPFASSTKATAPAYCLNNSTSASLFSACSTLIAKSFAPIVTVFIGSNLEGPDCFFSTTFAFTVVLAEVVPFVTVNSKTSPSETPDAVDPEIFLQVMSVKSTGVDAVFVPTYPFAFASDFTVSVVALAASSFVIIKS